MSLVRSRVVPHRCEINDLISGAGVKVPLRRKRNSQQLPHLTLPRMAKSGIMSARCQKQTFIRRLIATPMGNRPY